MGESLTRSWGSNQGSICASACPDARCEGKEKTKQDATLNPVNRARSAVMLRHARPSRVDPTSCGKFSVVVPSHLAEPRRWLRYSRFRPKHGFRASRTKAKQSRQQSLRACFHQETHGLEAPIAFSKCWRMNCMDVTGEAFSPWRMVCPVSGFRYWTMHSMPSSSIRSLSAIPNLG